MDFEKRVEICERVEKFLRDNRISADVNMLANGLPVIEVSIRWGDWKHEHLRAKWLLQEVGAIFMGSETTEEDGSDTYSAVHRFVVSEDILEGAYK